LEYVTKPTLISDSLSSESLASKQKHLMSDKNLYQDTIPAFLINKIPRYVNVTDWDTL